MQMEYFIDLRHSKSRNFTMKIEIFKKNLGKGIEKIEECSADSFNKVFVFKYFKVYFLHSKCYAFFALNVFTTH